MKLLIYSIFSILFLSSVASAQNDPNAKKILDEVSARLKSYKAINGSFSLLSKAKSGKVNNNIAGKISIKGNKYYIKQGTSEIFCDGNKIWNYNGNNEVTVTSVDASDEAITPEKLLTNFYDKDFTYKLVSSAGNYNQVVLTPNDKRKNFQKIDIYIDKAKMMITRGKVMDKGNNTIDFRLNNINTSADIPDNTFVFNAKKYKKDIEVIE